MRRSGASSGSAASKGQPVIGRIRQLSWLLLSLLLAVNPALAGSPKTKVLVGINRDYPPYEYLDAKGQPAGYDVDLLKAVAQLEDLEVEFRADTWDHTLRAFKEGRLDLMAGLLHSNAREAFADFSMPHLVVHYAIFIRQGEQGINNRNDLRGRSILVERQSEMHDHLQASGLGQKLILVDSEPEALRRLAAGEGDAAAAPQLQGLVLARQNHLPIQAVGGPLLTRQLSFAARKGELDLVSRLNTGLAILNQTGRYAEIYQAWFGHLQSDAGNGPALLRRWLFILALVGLALLLAVAWNWVLRRQVTQATERLRGANQEIHEREAHLDLIIGNLPVAVFAKDPKNNYTFTLWNSRSEELFGLTRAEVLGKNDFDFFPREQADFFRAKDEDVIRSRQILDIPEERIQSHSLGEILLHTRKVPLMDESGEPFLLLGISEDITKPRAMEEALRLAQKLESLGVLAGGIAHDFNNLLTAILGNLGLAGLQVPARHPAQPFLQNAEATALRAADLTRKMLEYSGRGVFAVTPVDLSALAEEMASLLQVSIPKRVALRYAFLSGLPRILGDSAQLQQVIMNLVTNAAEAMGDAAEGEVILSTDLVELDAAQAASLHPASPISAGQFVTLCVKDNGTGMSPEVVARIFDPFFTTKFSGRGLGLSAMLGILRAHHAGMQIKSWPGLGTEFRLFFPVAISGEQDGIQVESQPLPGRTHEGGTILLVDDEQVVRQSTSAMLRQAGFDVVEAEDGAMACDIYKRTGGTIQAVLMDLTMPKLDGRAAAAEILAFDPQARIILSSGFPQEADLHSSDERISFLPKPYRIDDLLRSLHLILRP